MVFEDGNAPESPGLPRPVAVVPVAPRRERTLRGAGATVELGHGHEGVRAIEVSSQHVEYLPTVTFPLRWLRIHSDTSIGEKGLLLSKRPAMLDHKPFQDRRTAVRVHSQREEVLVILCPPADWHRQAPGLVVWICAVLAQTRCLLVPPHLDRTHQGVAIH